MPFWLTKAFVGMLYFQIAMETSNMGCSQIPNVDRKQNKEAKNTDEDMAQKKPGWTTNHNWPLTTHCCWALFSPSKNGPSHFTSPP